VMSPSGICLCNTEDRTVLWPYRAGLIHPANYYKISVKRVNV
jgi:hypothetical protein